MVSSPGASTPCTASASRAPTPCTVVSRRNQPRSGLVDESRRDGCGPRAHGSRSGAAAARPAAARARACGSSNRRDSRRRSRRARRWLALATWSRMPASMAIMARPASALPQRQYLPLPSRKRVGVRGLAMGHSTSPWSRRNGRGRWRRRARRRRRGCRGGSRAASRRTIICTCVLSAWPTPTTDFLMRLAEYSWTSMPRSAGASSTTPRASAELQASRRGSC